MMTGTLRPAAAGSLGRTMSAATRSVLAVAVAVEAGVDPDGFPDGVRVGVDRLAEPVPYGAAAAAGRGGMDGGEERG